MFPRPCPNSKRCCNRVVDDGLPDPIVDVCILGCKAMHPSAESLSLFPTPCSGRDAVAERWLGECVRSLAPRGPKHMASRSARQGSRRPTRCVLVFPTVPWTAWLCELNGPENLDVALVCNVPTNFCVVLSGELS